MIDAAALSAMRRDSITMFITKLQHDSVQHIDEVVPTTEYELQLLETLQSELKLILERVQGLIMDAPSFVEECPAAPGEEGYVEEVA